MKLAQEKSHHSHPDLSNSTSSRRHNIHRQKWILSNDQNVHLNLAEWSRLGQSGDSSIITQHFY